MARLSKRQKQIQELVAHSQLFAPSEAVNLIKQTATAKFDETIEANFYLGINPKHADQQVRSTVSLPEGTGQTVRVVVAAKGEAVNAAKAAGAIEAGSDDLIEKIAGGWFEFDVLIATADMMAPLSRFGKVLGPKKLMPNPKAGTVVAPSSSIFAPIHALMEISRSVAASFRRPRSVWRRTLAVIGSVERAATARPTIDRPR